MRSIDDWIRILITCGCAQRVAARWAPVFHDEVKPGTFSQGDQELDDFLGQVLHESAMLTRLEEGLNYTRVERIREVWPKRFPTIEDAAPCVRNPRALANKVYGGRMGNIGPDDGWRYRGRGLLQVTGRDNYAALGNALKRDLLVNPDALLDPHIALRACIVWWERNVPDAVMGDVRKVTRRVNGGEHGLRDRAELAAAADKVV
jgi:putative chitinase